MNFVFAIPASLLAAAIGGWIAGQRAEEPVAGASCAGLMVLLGGGILGPIAITPAFLCGVALAFCFRKSEMPNGQKEEHAIRKEMPCPHCGRIVGATAKICPRCMNKMSTENIG